MAEKVYRAFDGAEIPQRDPSRFYKMKTDTDGKPCYVELNSADNEQKLHDEAAWLATKNVTPPPTVEERLAKLEAKVKP